MTGLSVADLERWNSQAVREVFDACRQRAGAALDVARGLETLQVFGSWGGDAATAAHSALAVTRADLDAHGAEAMAVAHAARDAADRIDAIKDRLQQLCDRAAALGLVVDAEASRVDVGRRPVGGPVDGLLNALALQHDLDAILADADAVDDELATAINMADGDAPIPVLSAKPQDVETQLQAPDRRLQDRLQPTADVGCGLGDGRCAGFAHLPRVRPRQCAQRRGGSHRTGPRAGGRTDEPLHPVGDGQRPRIPGWLDSLQ